MKLLAPEYKEQWIQSDWGFWNAVNASTYRVIYKDAKAEKEQYTVRMHFAELENLMPGERVFDIKLQGKVVEKSLDVLKAAGGQYTALIKEYKGVSTEGTIQIEFVPHGEAAKGKGHQPILNGLEIIRQK